MKKTATQALDRLDPVLPLSPVGAERHGFEYYRHGTLWLHAAVDVRTGEVFGETADWYTSEDFVRFMEKVVKTQPKDGRSISCWASCPPTRPRKCVGSWRSIRTSITILRRPAGRRGVETESLGRGAFHLFLMAEPDRTWFAKIERDLLARGIFTSRTDLHRKIMRYIEKHHDQAKPVRWAYTGV